MRNFCILLVCSTIITLSSQQGNRFRPGQGNFGGQQSGGQGNFGGQQFGGQGNFGGQQQVGPGQGNFPGIPHGGSADGPRGCFCLPANQVCEPNGPIPKSATRINKVATRIININPENQCPEGQRQCCFGSGGPLPPPGGDGNPLPLPITGCGLNNILFPGTSVGDQAEFGEYPWMTAILTETNNYVAGGVLVSPTAVVTAAHKFTQPGSLKVRVGEYDLSVANEIPKFPHQEVRVAQVIFHPQFNPRTLKNNIAVIKLSQPVHYKKHITPVCLPEPGQRFAQRCYVSGWGTDQNDKFQNIMKEVDLPIVDENECEDRLRKTRLGNTYVLDKESFLCAGGEFGKDTCRGDGGSPLVCQESTGIWTLVGLTAWGIGCAQDQVPGVYVNVATYSNFIKQNI